MKILRVEALVRLQWSRLHPIIVLIAVVQMILRVRVIAETGLVRRESFWVGFYEAKTVESVHAITVGVWLVRRCIRRIQHWLIGHALTS